MEDSAKWNTIHNWKDMYDFQQSGSPSGNKVQILEDVLHWQDYAANHFMEGFL